MRTAAVLLACLALPARTTAGQHLPRPAAPTRAEARASFTVARAPSAAPRAQVPSRRAIVAGGTVAVAAFGGILGWVLGDEAGDASCLGGESRSTWTGAAAGALVGLPLMLAVTAREDVDSATPPPPTSAPRGWALVRWKARSTLVATGASAVFGGGIGVVAGTMAHAQRPKACRSIGRAIGDGAASYGGAMIGLTVPMAILFDWPQ